MRRSQVARLLASCEETRIVTSPWSAAVHCRFARGRSLTSAAKAELKKGLENAASVMCAAVAAARAEVEEAKQDAQDASDEAVEAKASAAQLSTQLAATVAQLARARKAIAR